jgi:hypothetical protein
VDVEGAIKLHVFQLQPGQGGMSMAGGRASTRASLGPGGGAARALQRAAADMDDAGSEAGA